MSKLARVATAITKLTYSEMILLAEGIQYCVAEIPTYTKSEDSPHRLASGLSLWAESFDHEFDE